jgi:hypothetical protein
MPGRHPNPHYYASDAQKSYLVRLLREAFAKRVSHGLCLDERHLDRVPRAEASTAIDTLKRLLNPDPKEGVSPQTCPLCGLPVAPGNEPCNGNETRRHWRAVEA